jgi:thioredoxin 2
MEDTVFIRCLNCGTVNRVHRERLERKPVCGNCGNGLDTRRYSYGAPLDVSEETFHEEVLKSRIPVLVDCWAPWCAPCAAMGPMIEKLAEDFKGRLRVAKLNTDQNRHLAAQFEITSIPTLLVFKDGVLVDRVVGVIAGHQLDDLVDNWL